MDKAIKATVIGHLFGDESSLLNASIDTTIREDQSESGILNLKIDSEHSILSNQHSRLSVTCMDLRFTILSPGHQA